MKLFKIPFSGGGLGHGNGANLGSNAIEEQLKNVFSNEDGYECTFEIDGLTLNETNIAESHEKILHAVSEIKEKAILLGGDHSITHPTVKGFSKNMNDFVFVVFDAHPDLMDDFKPPTQEDYLRVLIEEEIVKPENCFLIGTRNWDKEEVKYLEEKKISNVSSKELFEKGFKEKINELTEKLKQIGKPIYLSVDIDVVDPVEAIGTGYIEHGGISSRELIYAIQKIKKTGLLQMADLVEINPSKDVNNITAILGAKIVAELFGF